MITILPYLKITLTLYCQDPPVYSAQIFNHPSPYFHMVFKKGRFQVSGAVSPVIQSRLVLVQVWISHSLALIYIF